MKISVGKQLVKQAPQYEQVVYLTLTEKEAHHLATFTQVVSPLFSVFGGMPESTLRELAKHLREMGY